MRKSLRFAAIASAILSIPLYAGEKPKKPKPVLAPMNSPIAGHWCLAFRTQLQSDRYVFTAPGKIAKEDNVIFFKYGEYYSSAYKFKAHDLGEQRYRLLGKYSSTVFEVSADGTQMRVLSYFDQKQKKWVDTESPKWAYQRCTPQQRNVHDEITLNVKTQRQAAFAQTMMAGLAGMAISNNAFAAARAGLVSPVPDMGGFGSYAGFPAQQGGQHPQTAGSNPSTAPSTAGSISRSQLQASAGRAPVNATFNCHSFSPIGTTGTFLHNNCGQTLTFWICDEPLCKSGAGGGALTIGAGSKHTMSIDSRSKYYLACPQGYNLDVATARCSYIGG